MKPIVFNWDANPGLFDGIVRELAAVPGEFERRRFPDGESYVRFRTQCANRPAILVAGLDRPDSKLISLLLAADTLRELGAASIGLAAPYLPYMRQDHAFQPGEGTTARHIARMLSAHFDWLVTVDPHLHRIHALDEIYRIPAQALPAAPALAAWLRANVASSVLIGPDSESEQWVSEVAALCGAPFTVLEKIRTGDRSVQVSVPDITGYTDRTPVIIDDIISSGHTVARAIERLVQICEQPPVCMGVHGIFAVGASEALTAAGAAQVVTTNTVTHESNAMDVSAIMAAGLSKALGNFRAGNGSQQGE